MINLTGTFSMIRLAAAAMRRPMPSCAGPQKTHPLKETDILPGRRAVEIQPFAQLR
jgi:hypothetical protein